MAFQRYQSSDIEGVFRAINRLEALHNANEQDPQRSSVESATMNCILMVAESYAIELNFDTALELCGSVFGMLEERRDRFVAIGNRPRPDSIVWCELLTTLGFIKWKAPVQYEDSVLTPSLMISEYKRIDTQIHQSITSIPYQDKKKNLGVLERPLGCGTEVARVAYRYLPSQVPLLLAFIKNNHGSTLENSDLPYYWSLKIAQTWCCRNTEPELLLDIYTQLENSLANYWGEHADLGVTLKSIQIEKEYLLVNSPLQL